MKSASLFSLKTLLPLAIVACLSLASSPVAAQNTRGLYKPAKSGDANVEFGNQSIHGGESGSNKGTVKKRRVSRYYAERCLRPGPLVQCFADGKCVERAKPAACSEQNRAPQKQMASQPQEARVSPLDRTRQRRAEEKARREQTQAATTNDGTLQPGEVRLTPAGDPIAMAAKNKQAEAAKLKEKNE